eukprot:15157871-Alexandrium_andersonii.AAC.1
MAVDIHKCFDQVVRPLILTTAAVMGCPVQVTKAWYGMLSALECFNSFGPHIGEAHSRPCSLPQGCPLSMMWIAMASRPLLCILETVGSVPRVLADDWLITVRGLAHYATFVLAGDLTHSFLADLGARIS